MNESVFSAHYRSYVMVVKNKSTQRSPAQAQTHTHFYKQWLIIIALLTPMSTS